MNLLQKVERNHGKHSMKFRFCTRFFVSLILMCGYLGDIQQILDGTTFRILSTFGDFVYLQPVTLTFLCKEHHGIMHGCRINMCLHLLGLTRCDLSGSLDKWQYDFLIHKTLPIQNPTPTFHPKKCFQWSRCL